MPTWSRSSASVPAESGASRVGPSILECGRPYPSGLLVVLAGEPGQEVAVVAGGGQAGRVAAGGVEEEQVPHQQGCGPAVEEHVVCGQDEFGPVGCEDDECQPEQWWGGRVEVGGAVLCQEPLEGLGALRLRQRGQVEVLPRQRHRLRHHLDDIAVRPVDERRPEACVASHQRLSGPAHPFRVDVAGELEGKLHVVGVVRRRSGQQGVEVDPGLCRGRRPHLGQFAEAGLPGVDLALVDVDQRGVGRGQATGFGGAGVPGQGGQRLDPQCGQLAHLVAGKQPGREAEVRGEFVAVGARDGHRVDLQRRLHRHVRVRRGDQVPVRGVGGPAQAAQCLGDVRAGGPAEVVESDLGFRELGQWGRGLRVEVAQQAVADAVVGDRPQLLLDRLDRPAGGRAARERVRLVDAGQVEAHREHRGEPSDRAGQIRAGRQLLVPAVSFEPHQHRGGGHAPRPAPPGQGEGQAGQQSVVDTAAEDRGHRVQQRFGDIGGQADAHGVGGGRDIARPVQLPCSQNGLVLAQDPLPHGEFGHPLRGRGLVGQGVCPSAQRGAHAVRSGVRPSRTCCQADTRSGTRIRQDTPSMARWCRTINRRFSPAWEVNHTNCAMTPASGASRPAAASSSAFGSASL